ncbi:MAG: hypothetical protein HGA90_04255 [Alphaproteobacteria bacterium]|nr:hypothetical protein [Alphaproteobacteria bacterium]
MYKGIARTEAQARHIGSVVRHIHTYGGSTRLVAGRDTMCGPCRCPQQHARDERMLKALNENLGMNLKIGDSVLITRAFTESVREVFPRLLEHCSPCRFYDDCAQIAASGFGGCKLWPRKANMAPLSLIRG